MAHKISKVRVGHRLRGRLGIGIGSSSVGALADNAEGSREFGLAVEQELET